MSKKKSGKARSEEVNLFSGHVGGLKIAGSLCEFQVTSKKHGAQQFFVDTKDNAYLGVVLAAMAGKHKINVQPSIGNGSEGGIASITIGEFQKASKSEKPVKSKTAEKSSPEPSTTSA